MGADTIVLYPVDKVPRSAFIEGLNTAYRDYYVPIAMTPATFAEFVARESVLLSASAAALDGERVVGMGMLGVRGLRGWIGGMGVHPDCRRQGIGRRLMHYLLDRARDLGLAQIQLEVIVQNRAAYQLYCSLGFETRRRLLVLQRDESPFLPLPVEAVLSVEPCPPSELLASLAHLQAVLRPWQREQATLEHILDRLEGLAAYAPEGEVIGVCLFSVDTRRVGLFDLAAVDGAVGRDMLGHLYAKHPHASSGYVNVPQDDPMLAALWDVGFRESLSQYEMIYSLTPGTLEPDQE